MREKKIRKIVEKEVAKQVEELQEFILESMKAAWRAIYGCEKCVKGDDDK